MLSIRCSIGFEIARIATNALRQLLDAELSGAKSESRIFLLRGHEGFYRHEDSRISLILLLFLRVTLRLCVLVAERGDFQFFEHKYDTILLSIK